MVTFTQVMESGSITATAARLNLSKSVISKRMSDLEAALDVALFQRSARQLKPTESGIALYETMVPLIREINETAERVSSRQQALHGRLRITTPMSFGTMYLGPVIAEFARRHPDLELAIDYDDRMVDLVRNGYDLGIRIGHLKDSSLIARKLCDCPRVVCCSPTYAKERGLPKGVADLAAHACIDYAHVHTTQLWQFQNRKADRKPISVLMRSRIIANNGEAMRDMAIAGLGLVLMPVFLVAQPLREGKLIPALPGNTPVPYTISVVYPSTHHVPTKIRTFIDYAIRFFSPAPPWERRSEAKAIDKAALMAPLLQQ